MRNTAKNTLNVKTPLAKMFLSGKLGSGMKAVERFQAGMRFCEDYRRSFFVPRLTTVYDNMPTSKGRKGVGDFVLSSQNAAERYLSALKFLGKYEIYALHFLRDEKNVYQFIQANPVLCASSMPTYAAVYRTINKMLDNLADFYVQQDKKR